MSPSLYVHIPFCLKRCIYCDFVSGIYDPDRVDSYVEVIKKELSNIPEKTIIPTLYIGGGTPTALGPRPLSNLLGFIFNRFNLSDSEASIEANPGTLDRGKLQAIRSSGINRMSVGVQSFIDDELSFLGRIHTKEEAEAAVALAREEGFRNIGIDLIYGTPGQTIESWSTTLARAVSVRPEHISTYELTVEKGTVLHAMQESKAKSNNITFNQNVIKPYLHNYLKFSPLGEDQIIEMHEHTIDYLTAAGYIHYEISNFALPGHECRHNLNYWDRGEYYGAGVGAHSFIKGERSSNTGNLDDYVQALTDTSVPVRETELVTEERAIQEALFLGLRKTGGIRMKSFRERYKRDIEDYYKKELKTLCNAGLIDITSPDSPDDSVIRLTRKGLRLSNEVFTKFL